MNYFKKLISSKCEDSHKRFLSICAFGGLLICIIANLFGKTIQEPLIYVFAAICFGQSGLTMLDKLKK